jgi:hypothetical protein
MEPELPLSNPSQYSTFSFATSLSMSYPPYQPSGYGQSQPPPNQSGRVPPNYERSNTGTYYPAPAASYAIPQQYGTPLYYYPPPYSQPKAPFPQERVVILPQRETQYGQTRPPPPPPESFQRVKQVPPPAHRAPEPKKSRMAKPPPPRPEPPRREPPPPKPQPKAEPFQISLPGPTHLFVDYHRPPGSFNIMARGNLPQIEFQSVFGLPVSEEQK